MNATHSDRRSPLPAWLYRLENAEPYVAIRLCLIQGGIALALAWTAGVHSNLPEVVDFLPFSLGGVLRRETVFLVGYPLRELIWAGEWWRLPIGVFLPPGLGIFLLGLLAFLPLAKVLEARVDRRTSFLVYFLGGASVLLVELSRHPGETSGGLGMVFAAAGAVWALHRFEPKGSGSAPLPWQTTFFLVLLLMICVLPKATNPALPLLLANRSLAIVSPSWVGLLAALLTGMATVLPFAAKRYPMGDFMEDLRKPRPAPPRLFALTTVSGAWFIGFVAVCAWSWWVHSRLDHLLWNLEPGVREGVPDARAKLRELAAESPGHRSFAAKRLAVAHLRDREWEPAEEILLSLAERELEEDSTQTRLDLLNQMRLINLNVRGRDQIDPMRFSGASGNYSTMEVRLAQDLAHLAQLRGETETLAARREKLLDLSEEFLASVEIRPATEPAISGDPRPTSEEFQSQRLNERAYLAAELGGDLQVALKQAVESVEIKKIGDNLDTLGWIEIKSGSAEQGVAHLREALHRGLSFSSGTTYYHLGVGYDLLGEKEKARSFFEEALSRDLEWWEELDLFERCPDCSPSNWQAKRSLDAGREVD
jgi:tetratricopeptide (TPR) repeat protein